MNKLLLILILMVPAFGLSQPNCKTGKPCGNSCISIKKTCHIGPDAPPTKKRSKSARQEFLNQTGYPNGRPGYIVDHIIPLACGGADAPSNMQWMLKAEAKAKDKIELDCVVKGDLNA